MKLTVAIHVEETKEKEEGKRHSGTRQELHWAEMVENVAVHQLISHEIFHQQGQFHEFISLPEKKLINSPEIWLI